MSFQVVLLHRWLVREIGESGCANAGGARPGWDRVGGRSRPFGTGPRRRRRARWRGLARRASVDRHAEADAGFLARGELAAVGPAHVSEFAEAGRALLAVGAAHLDLVGRRVGLAAVGRERDVGVVAERAAADQRGAGGNRVVDRDVAGGL